MTTPNAFKSKSGVARIGGALSNSLAGLSAAWREEAAFRQEVVLAVLLLPVLVLVPASLTQKAIMLGALALVLIVELANSALEATVDRISLERHPLAKRAKDVASAAVFVALLNVVVVWGLILFEVYSS